MKRLIQSSLLVGLVIGLTGCAGCTRVGPGYVGIKTVQAGTNRGVQDYPGTTGWVFYNPFTESVLEYPTFVQIARWTKSLDEGHPVNEEITFTTKDKMQVAADISIAYSLQQDRVPHFYVKFRNDDIDAFTHGFLRNLAREKMDTVAGRYSVDQIMGDNAPFLLEAKAQLQTELDGIGVKIEQFGFIGAPRPPATVTESINATTKAAQLVLQKNNEVMQAEADAKKAVAEAEGQSKSAAMLAEGEAQATLTRARAQAQANKLLNESLTQTLIEYRKLDKWDGQLPQVQSGSNGIILSLPERQNKQ